MDHLLKDIKQLIMKMLDLPSLFRFGRCSKGFYELCSDEEWWNLKLLGDYLIKTNTEMSALQSYKFCVYAGRKKSTAYNLFMINELKDLKTQKVSAVQRLNQSQRKWKIMSEKDKNQWKVIASTQTQNSQIHSLWLALSEKEREKFGIAAANYKKNKVILASETPKKKRPRKHKHKEVVQETPPDSIPKDSIPSIFCTFF